MTNNNFTKSKVMHSIELDGFSLEFMDDKWFEDEHIVHFAISRIVDAHNRWNFYSRSRTKDEEDEKGIVMERRRMYAMVARMSEGIRSNKLIMMGAVGFSASVLGLVSIELKDDEEIVLIAIEQDVYLMKFASDRLKNDRNIMNSVMGAACLGRPL